MLQQQKEAEQKKLAKSNAQAANFSSGSDCNVADPDADGAAAAAAAPLEKDLDATDTDDARPDEATAGSAPENGAHERNPDSDPAATH